MFADGSCLVPLHLFGAFLYKGNEWGGNGAETLNEPLIKIGKAKEALEFFHCLGCRPLCHSSYLGFIHGYPLLANDIPQEGNCGNVEITFHLLHRFSRRWDNTCYNRVELFQG